MLAVLYDSLSSHFVENLINLAVAALLSGLIGLERGFHGRAAGMRTNILVGLGACLFMILSSLIAASGQIVTGAGVGVPDPGRIAAQIVTGIGFLGAGTIIKSGVTVRGLTTASCMWIVAAIGMACGAGYLALATIATFCALGILLIVSAIEGLLPSHSYRRISLVVKSEEDVNAVIDVVKDMAKLQHVNFEYNHLKDEYKVIINVRLLRRSKTDIVFGKVYKRVSDATTTLQSIKWTLQG
jgi:putative Mg2+ transporter-C (MgtC) family protein